MQLVLHGGCSVPTEDIESFVSWEWDAWISLARSSFPRRVILC